jgi:hypothetical protein
LKIEGFRNDDHLSFSAARGKWRAQKRVSNTQIYMGEYKTVEEARLVRDVLFSLYQAELGMPDFQAHPSWLQNENEYQDILVLLEPVMSRIDAQLERNPSDRPKGKPRALMHADELELINQHLDSFELTVNERFDALEALIKGLTNGNSTN